jgi:hypothetical protein
MKLSEAGHILQPIVIYCLLGPNISLRTLFLTSSVGVLPMTRKDFVILAALHWGFSLYLKNRRLRSMIAQH